MQVCTSLQTDNHANTPPLSFLQAGCPSCRPTNSVKALKDYSIAQHFNFGPCDPSQKIQAEHFIASAPSPPGVENPSYATGHATLSPGQSPLTGAAAAAAAAKAA